MKFAHSILTKYGIYVDCAECKQGGNGNGTCIIGGKHKLICRGMCLKGALLENLKVMNHSKKEMFNNG